MRRRRLAHTVLALLERAGWVASTDWIVCCRDGRSHMAQLRLGVSTDGVTIDVSQSGPLTLTATETEQLRAALRDALLTRVPLVPSEPPAPRRPGTPAPSEGSEDPHGKHDAPRWPAIDLDCRLRRAE